MCITLAQSEISPADHVRNASIFPEDFSNKKRWQRGLLGSVEFTGNIIGYASSVVRFVTCLYQAPYSLNFTVDRLCLFILSVRLVLAPPAFCSMYRRLCSLHRQFRHTRVSSVSL